MRTWLALVLCLASAAPAGARFTVENRTPSQDVYAGTTCRGVRVEILDRKSVRGLDIFVHAVGALRRTKPSANILAAYEASWRAFDASRAKYLLY